MPGTTRDDPSAPEPWPETAIDTDALPPQTEAVGPDEPDRSCDRRSVNRPVHPTRGIPFRKGMYFASESIEPIMVRS